jgi:acid phosphatase type 7
MSMDNSSAPLPNTRGLGFTPFNAHFYSYNVGLVHFVAMSTETYFSYPDAVKAQYQWMDADLAAVDRATTPWVIVFGHRSIYCSCDSDCDSDATVVREGANGMEELFRKHSVDIWINGHEVRQRQ